MRHRASTLFSLALLLCLAPVASLAMAPYAQDFEALNPADPNALGSDGWLVFGNVYDSGGGFLYGYGPFPAPNHALAFSAIAIGEGGVDQGDQQLNIFNDYENLDHQNFPTRLIESNVFQEQTITVADTGMVWTFAFQHKRGNIVPPSTAAAFIKTIDPNNGFIATNFVQVDMSSIDPTWGGTQLQLEVTTALVGQLFQFGFLSIASNYESSANFYDNIELYSTPVTGVPELPTLPGAAIQRNFPNPFNFATRIAFTLDEAEPVSLKILDITGRRVATLRDEVLGAGGYEVTWDGRTDNGTRAAAGQYYYVLQTSKGRVAQRMTLLK